MKNFLLVLLFTVSQFAGAQQHQFEQLFSKFKAAANFDYQYPREKVYLHLDNNAYYEDETIWFKAYVMRASTLQPTTLSRVLYVELLKDDGSLMERKLLRVDSLGQANGEFKLELPIKSGFYEVRAYTREMVNWGQEACYSRVVPIFEKPTSKRKKEIKLEDINSDELKIPYPADNKRNEHLADEQAKKIKLQFFPEGGNRVQGVAQRIAFLLTDGRGAELTDEIKIFRENGSLQTTADCEHLGMGTFQLPADFGEGGYAEIKGKRFDLPAVEEAQQYALQTAPESDGVTVYISPSPTAEPELLGLVIHCRDKMCYLDTLTLYHEPLGLFVPNTVLHGGINRIELINTAGESLCRRLVWKSVPERNLNLNIRQSKKKYNAFSPVALEMDLKDNNGKPVAATFSLSVRDDAGDLVRANTPSAGADILLSSELKGYIHQPDFYFEADDAAHQRALDLLLLVQGWSANSFETLCGQQPFVQEQPIEEQLTLNGYAYQNNDKKEPYPNLGLKVKMYSLQGGSLEAETVTDSLGKFAFVSNVDYTGNWIAQITTQSEEGKNKWSRIAFDRWFSPELRPMDYRETVLETPMPRVYNMGADTIQDIFNWTDTISDQKSVLLGTAVVKTKKKYKGLTGNRYTYNGGEKAGMRQSDEFYNIEVEVERYKDKGLIPGDIQSFLGTLSKDFSLNYSEEASDTFIENEKDGQTTASADQNSNEFVGINGAANDHTANNAKISYRGHSIRTYLNNGAGGINAFEVGELKAEEVKSVAIVKGAARVNHIMDHDFNINVGIGKDQTKQTETAEDTYRSLFIYELPDAYLFRTKKGIEKRRIWGYSIPAKFFQPDYTQSDLPTKKDVRRTLYWNPSIKTDENGRASALFYTNCREEVELRISARGVTMDGRMVSVEK